MLRPRFCEDDGCYPTVPRVVLTLLRPGATGDELFVDYGDETAKRFLHNQSASPCPEKIKQFHEQHFYADPRNEEVPASEIPGESVSALTVVTLGSDSMIVEHINDALSRTVRQTNNSTFPIYMTLIRCYSQ